MNKKLFVTGAIIACIFTFILVNYHHIYIKTFYKTRVQNGLRVPFVDEYLATNKDSFGPELYKSISILSSITNDACVLRDSLDNDWSKYNCYCSKRFSIFLTSLHMYLPVSLLIFDHHKNTVEFYDPYQSFDVINKSDSNYCTMDNYTLFNRSYTHKNMHTNQCRLKRFTCDPGFCITWSMYVAHVKLLNPDMSVYDINVILSKNKLVNHLKTIKKYQTMVDNSYLYDDISLGIRNIFTKYIN